jgi:long-chain acyl-CoA synthetase
MTATSFSLSDLVRRNAQVRPDHLALVCGPRRLTYAELEDRSSRAGSALVAAGIAPGARVALLARNRAEYYELVFGASKAGASLAALNWRLAEAELAAILEDCLPALLIVEPELASLVDDAAARHGIDVLELGAGYERWLEHSAPEDPEVAVDPDDVVLQLYSSGTTGVPKGIMLTHRNLSFSARHARELFTMDAASVNMVVSPLFHIGGVGYGTMAMFVGGTTVVMSDAAAGAALEAIEAERVTHTFLVPAVIQALVSEAAESNRDLSSLQRISYGGATMSEVLLHQAMGAFRCEFQAVYGMTETAGTVIALEPGAHVAEGPEALLLGSVGRPLSWLEVRVVDLRSGVEAPVGTVGEIWVRSGQNMKGYWRQPEATAEVVVDGGWLRTGDAALRDEDGYLFLQDRIKDMIISGGENIYPAEVENVLAAHPAVAEVAVIGVPHERWGETVKALVIRRDGAAVDAEELADHARSRLARYKCPTSFEWVDDFPRNASGKVLKKVLRERYAGRSVSA